MYGGSSKQAPEFLSSLNSEQTPLKKLMEHIKDELGIEVELEGAAAQSQYSMSSVSSIATTIKTNPEQRITALREIVKEYVMSFNYIKSFAEAEILNTIEERNKTMGEIALAMIAQKRGKSDQQLERIRAKIKENRKKEHLQTELVIHNSVAHTDYQAKLSKEDNDKVLMEFREGMARLNNEFKKFGLSEVRLSQVQLKALRDMYEKKSTKIQGGSAGSHYRITGPFIIPSARQPLSLILICDRWVALSVFVEVVRSKDHV